MECPVSYPSCRREFYSSTSDMLKFLSVNMGLIKTKLNDAMQESHLIRHSTGFLLPNNLQASK